jgi:hypothetical protein
LIVYVVAFVAAYVFISYFYAATGLAIGFVFFSSFFGSVGFFIGYFVAIDFPFGTNFICALLSSLTDAFASFFKR